MKKVIVGKTGKNKGQTKVTHTLIIGPHSFRNRGREHKEVIYFCCTACEKLKKTTNAFANCIIGESPEDDKYVLVYAPPLEEHKCQLNGYESFIKVAKMDMRRKVQEDPSRSIPEIYDEVRKSVFNQFDEFGQIQLAQHFPSYRSIQSDLYKERRCFIPPEPKNASELNINGDLFYLDEAHKETMIKGDTLLDIDRRVILISTDSHLETHFSPLLLLEDVFSTTLRRLLVRLIREVSLIEQI